MRFKAETNPRIHTIRKCMELLSPKDRKRVYLASLIQALTGFLDLLGIVILGIVGGLAVNGVQSHVPNGNLKRILEILGIQNRSLQFQVALLVSMAASILITKTFLSIIINRRTLFFLSRKSAEVSTNMLSRLLGSPIPVIQKYTLQELIFNVTSGVEAATVRLLGSIVNLVADCSLLLTVSVGLLVLNPSLALTIFILFGLISLALYWNMHFKAEKLGRDNSLLEIESRQKISEVISSYRELLVHGRRQAYLGEISELRKKLTKTSAEIAFLPSVGKYVFESAIVLGSLIIGMIQFILNDAVNAVAALSLFLAAGSRIAPALLRIQQSALQIRGSIASAHPALEFNENLDQTELKGDSVEVSDFTHHGFSAEVILKDVFFTYPDANGPALQSISLHIPEGNIVAVVGSSGAGKSTLADILLGILTPDSGSVLVSKLDPLLSIEKWPGAISYVPQTISVINGSIRDNITLGSPNLNISDSQVNEAIVKAHLSDFVFAPEKGLDFTLSESGSNLSGGQKQRLGLARALFTQPKLLVLDEATSALDSQTENEVTKSINALKGNTTVVIIAHRLSTVRNADQIIYMSDGKVVAQGTFADVRAKVPDFDLQANLMRL